MKPGTLCIEKDTPETTRENFLIENCRRILLSRLKNLQHGELILNDGSDQYVFGRHDEIYAHTVTVTISNREFYLNMLLNGALGSGESYINGYWQCDNLTALVELFLCNREHISKIGPGLKYLVQPLRLLQRFMHRNI
jgi:cyclopropane-fatty-acyl-phospholipid synthase